MSSEGFHQFLARVRNDPVLQKRLRDCSPAEAAALAQSLGYAVRCGDLVRYESRAFAWQLSDHEYDWVVRLQRVRQHWWQMCWPD
mgnify:CR=1 FL=1